ncbi:DUF4041 domain-containing protein [Streptomyces sp900105755]|uniref:DUF4041 domain-containing protein n=1 Tax=Streptomyces sp. 900105755 TaxID=3154389 RepID=UPI0033166A74
MRHARREAQATRQEAAINARWDQPDDASDCRMHLDSLRNEIKNLARADRAVSFAQDWTVNGAGSEGRKAARNFSKLVLKAYNAEADYAVRTMKPHHLALHVDRLCRSRETIAKLGSRMRIRISDAYHDARVRELYLMAALLEQEQEQEQEQSQY